MKRLAPCLLALFSLSCAALAVENFYVGTYTKPGGSQGIYQYELDSETGAVKALGLASECTSPSYLVLHPNGRFLYAVNEGGGGGASAFAVQPDGTLKELNKEPTLGDGPTHIALDADGKNVLVANYGGGSVAVLPILPDGRLGKSTGFMQHKGTGPDARRQKGPHAHGVAVVPGGNRVLVADLGVDKVFCYELDSAKGALSPAEPPFLSVAPGAGPRHLVVGASGVIYVLNEMANTVTAFGADGAELQTITTLPADFTGDNTTAEIQLHPNGETLYVSNRGHNSVALFKVAKDGRLKAAGHVPCGGENPRFIGLNPSGQFLLVANQKSGNVVVLRVDSEGRLTDTGVKFAVPEPVCVLFRK